jgi:hypothetical protein
MQKRGRTEGVFSGLYTGMRKSFKVKQDWKRVLFLVGYFDMSKLFSRCCLVIVTTSIA